MVTANPTARRVAVEWCPASRVAQLQRLIDRHWRAGHVLARDEALLRWQYRHLTQPDRLAVMVAIDRDSDEMIGCLGLIQAPFGDRGREHVALWMSMWLLVPEARGQGIGFSLLDRAIREGYRVIGCVGFNDITKRLVSGMGFHLREAMPRWVRPIDSSALAALTACRAQAYSESIQRRWRDVASGPIPGASGEVVAWSAVLEPAWDQAWTERFAPALVATWHDSDYLRWRYLDHPAFDYSVRVARARDGAVQGLLVHRIEPVQDRPERTLRIVELLGDAAATEVLLRDALAAGAAAGVAFADLHSTASDADAILQGLGFYRDDQQPEDDRLPRFFQPLDFRSKPLNFTLWLAEDMHRDLETYVAASSLYFTRADGDQDRPN